MEQLRVLRRQHGLSQTELAERIGVHQTAISQWEKGRTNPDQNSLMKLAEVFGVSYDTLLGGTNSKYMIPVLGEIRAGVPTEAFENILGYEEITPQMARAGQHFALRVKGESMQPRFCPGDIVIVRKQSDADSGDIVAALVAERDATVKKLIKKENGIVLMPLNPAFEPMIYSEEEVETLPVTLLGKVVELRAKF